MFAYFPKSSKSYLTGKEQHYNKEVDAFMWSKRKITTEGERHLVAIIGSKTFKVSYTKSLVGDWITQLKLLSIIAKSELQSAYSGFGGGFKGKLTYFRRSILSLRDLLKPLEYFIRFNFIPAINGGHLWTDNCEMRIWKV